MTSGNNPDNLTNKDLGHVSGGGKGAGEPKLPEQEEKKKVEPINPDKVLPDDFLKKVDGGAKAPDEKVKPKTSPDKDVAPEPGDVPSEDAFKEP